MMNVRGNEWSADEPGEKDSCDVVVVGGGLAGLTAALAAVDAGARVTLVDAHTVGGRARSVARNGFTLNEGGHALYNGAGRAVLDGLGARIQGRRPDVAGYELVWDGEIVPMPVSPAALATTRLLGVRSKVRLTSLFASLSRSLPDDSASLDDWLDQRGVRPDLRKYLMALLRLGSYAADPGAQPAGIMCRQLLAGQAGVVYVDGGWQHIVDDLRRLADRAGVVVREREPVRSLSCERGEWAAVTDDRVVRGHAVVLAAGGPARAVSLLGDDVAGWVERAGEPQRAACLDVGCRSGTSSFLLSADEPLYLSLHGPTADLAPPGTQLYSVMRYLDGDDDRSPERNRAELESHAARGGLPVAAERLVDRFLAAPVVTWGRPVVGVERPTGFERSGEGVFAAGDWMSEHVLADASIVSGAAAGRAAARHAAHTAARHATMRTR